MIYFTSFGKHGRLGNQMFQWASLIGLSKRFNTTFALPQWEYSRYFVHPPAVATQARSRMKKLTEPRFDYCPEYWEQNASILQAGADVIGWLQTEKYWTYDTEAYMAVCEAMQFKDDFKTHVCSKLRAFQHAAPIIAISVRRGDYVRNPNYKQLPIDYYLGALYRNFPDYHRMYNIIVFSDDIDYCRVHFRGLMNVTFAEGLNAIEQLCAMSMCDNFIIANSTFSWWGAYLAGMEKQDAHVVCPAYLFDGEMLAKNSEKDFYPEHWVRFDHLEHNRGDMSDTTFVIPVKVDSKDRVENLRMALFFLREHFETAICIMENAPDGNYKLADIAKTYECRYMKSDDRFFHRTKMINEMVFACDTPYFFNWDADVLVPPAQVIEAIRLLRSGVDVAYPYDGRFARVGRDWISRLNDWKDLGIFAGITFKGMRHGDAPSVGGAIGFNKASFARGGMENENFISYGPEDVERLYRFQRLGFAVARTHGVLYHLDHVITPDSDKKHGHFLGNERELAKVQDLTVERLREYVDAWPWRNRYNEGYYDTITDGSIKSRNAVFTILNDLGVFNPNQAIMIIDVGCGVGQWGYEMEEAYGHTYTGVDHHVPLQKLLIPKDHYKDIDLAVDFPVGEYDLALCLEVAEHLEAKHAERIVEGLCKLAPVVLFSAAIPNQGGEDHRNEQWQRYWSKLFLQHGFTGYQSDFLIFARHNPDIEVWYKQNIVIYSKRELNLDPGVQDFVHPQMFTNVVTTLKWQMHNGTTR